MKLTEDKGVTLMTLVITIIILLILSSIGVEAGMSTINSTNFTQFKDELEILQTKVNQLNQGNELNIGEDLNSEQKQVLNKQVISDIIYNDKSDEEKLKIQNGFRYCDKEYIKNNLEIGSIKRDYLINVEYRYIICYEGFSYNNVTYYIINQIDNGVYNIQYNDKNEKTGSFEVNSIKEGNRWKIEISDIEYNGYINNWQVKYRLDGDTNWKTSNGLSFYVTKQGNYYVNVIYGDDIDLGTKLVSIIEDIENTIDTNIIE